MVRDELPRRYRQNGLCGKGWEWEDTTSCRVMLKATEMLGDDVFVAEACVV